jgi:hypothetical protein
MIAAASSSVGAGLTLSAGLVSTERTVPAHPFCAQQIHRAPR